MISKAAKYVGAVLLAAILLIVFVINFSEVESRYECTGEVMYEGQSDPQKVFLKLAEYRWWVSLWSESDAAVWTEVPDESTEYYGHVVELGEILQIRNDDKRLAGEFSKLSKSLAIETWLGRFNGTCKRIVD